MKEQQYLSKHRKLDWNKLYQCIEVSNERNTAKLIDLNSGRTHWLSQTDIDAAVARGIWSVYDAVMNPKLIGKQYRYSKWHNHGEVVEYFCTMTNSHLSGDSYIYFQPCSLKDEVWVANSDLLQDSICLQFPSPHIRSLKDKIIKYDACVIYTISEATYAFAASEAEARSILQDRYSSSYPSKRNVRITKIRPAVEPDSIC